MLNNLLILNT